VRNVDNTPYTKESDMKNMVSCNAASKATMLSMGSLELLLRVSVFTVLDTYYGFIMIRSTVYKFPCCSQSNFVPPAFRAPANSAFLSLVSFQRYFRAMPGRFECPNCVRPFTTPICICICICMHAPCKASASIQRDLCKHARHELAIRGKRFACNYCCASTAVRV